MVRSAHNIVDSTKVVAYFEKELGGIAADNMNYYELYIEKALIKHPEDEALWEYYIRCTEACKNNMARLRVLRRACKNCRENIEFKILLLRENEKSGVSAQVYEGSFSINKANRVCDEKY